MSSIFVRFKTNSMKGALRLVLLGILISHVSFGQNDNPPRNEPSQTGYLQQAITENNATLFMLGMDPVQVKQQKAVSAQQGTTPAATPTTPTTTQQQQPVVPVVQQVQTPVAVPADTPVVYVDTTRLPSSSIFGHDYFRNKNYQMFDRTTDAQAMGNYVVGVGDQIGINVWGYSSYSGSYSVDQTGSIMPEGVGKIYVKGLTLDKAKQLIRSRFATYLDMPNSQIEVTIIYSRVISVNIVGDVFNPGSYSIPALNTAFNALLASGGPTDLGTVRQIFVKRQGQTVRTLDVYKFLLDPNSNTDFFLENNDYIFVPPAQKIVSIGGEVNRPFKYEIVDGEDLSDLIKYAGGLTSKAYTRAVQVKRYTGGQFVLTDVNLDSLTRVKGKYALANGDEVLVGTVPQEIFRFVKVSGAVMQPGQYSYSEGMRISDLVSKAHGLTPAAMGDRAYIMRKNADLSSSYITFTPDNVMKNPASAENLVLQNMDEVVFFDKRTFADSTYVNVSGAVRLPGKYAYAAGLTLNDLLYTAGGMKPEAGGTRVEVSRYQSDPGGKGGGPRIVATFPIDSSLAIQDDGDSYRLNAYDFVFVRSVVSRDSQMVVTLKGEVMFPGSYALTSKTENLVSVIERAGGLTQWADANQTTLIRNDENRGIVTMELDKALDDPKSRYNIILKPGDVIDVPITNDLVTISGMINYPYKDSLGFINTPFNSGKSAKWYIKTYGLGFDKYAERKRTYVIQPGGTVEGVRHTLFFRNYPTVQKGGYVVVPYTEQAAINQAKDYAKNGVTTDGTVTTTVQAEPVDWNQVIESAMIKITGLLTLYVLITRINF
jgi:protein involved in polysaccharide export with SLBB domain